MSCLGISLLLIAHVYIQCPRFVHQHAVKGAMAVSLSPQAEDIIPPPLRHQLLKEWQTFNPQWQEEQPKKLPDFIIKGQYNCLSSSKSNNNSNNTNPHHTHRDIILATHTSIDKDKLHRIDILQRYWQGPISLAIRIRSEMEIHQFFDYYEQLPTRVTNIWTVHFLLEKLPIQDIESNSFAAQYCHNSLRNLALHSPSIPDFVLGVDLDFVPTYGGYPKLMNILQDHPSAWDRMKKDKTLLVVPVMEVLHIPSAWGYSADPKQQNTSNNKNTLVETLREIDSTPVSNRTKAQKKLVNNLQSLEIYEKGVESDLPKSREDLKLLYKYRAAREWHHKPGHEPTNLHRYWGEYSNKEASLGGESTGTAANNKKMSYSIQPTYYYEPYFIGYKPDLPKYWEGFRGYGLNKQSFVRECILAGFTMEALFELYLTHLAHPSNVNRKIKRTNQKEWDTKFQYHLEKHYEKPKWDPNDGEWWYSDPMAIGRAADRPKYVTNIRAQQHG